MLGVFSSVVLRRVSCAIRAKYVTTIEVEQKLLSTEYRKDSRCLSNLFTTLRHFSSGDHGRNDDEPDGASDNLGSAGTVDEDSELPSDSEDENVRGRRKKRKLSTPLFVSSDDQGNVVSEKSETSIVTAGPRPENYPEVCFSSHALP